MKVQQSYSFDDLGLIPLVKSEVESRNDINTSCKFLGLSLSLPVVSAPMEKTTGIDLAIALQKAGGLPFLPRTDDFEVDFQIFKNVFTANPNVVPSIPTNKDSEKRFERLYEAGARYICVDCANGYSVAVERAIKKIRKLAGDKIKIVTGNVASLNGYKFLKDLGVDGVRIGIGSGSVCLTSMKTAIGVGQASLIREIADYKYSCNNDAPAIIADGGIKGAADIIKSIALGADVCMAGKLFASCKESPGTVVKYNNKLYKQYAGQASFIIKKSENFVEGEDTLISYTGSLDRLLKDISDGLKSAMSYLNCKTLYELKYLGEDYFVILSNAAKIERVIHANF